MRRLCAEASNPTGPVDRLYRTVALASERPSNGGMCAHPRRCIVVGFGETRPATASRSATRNRCACTRRTSFRGGCCTGPVMPEHRLVSVEHMAGKELLKRSTLGMPCCIARLDFNARRKFAHSHSWPRALG
jgi:hypothetical protein